MTKKVEYKIEGNVGESKSGKAWFVPMNGVIYTIPKSQSEIVGDKIYISDWLDKKLEKAGAMFSDDRKRRYFLWRIWNDTKKTALCIGLNPSTAKEDKNDPTIFRLNKVLSELGYGGLVMVNLFTIISPDPGIVITPDARDNEKFDLGMIFGQALSCQEVIFCWGDFPDIGERANKVIQMFPDAVCFGKNKNGTPWHPRALWYAFDKKSTKKITLFNFRKHTYEQNRYERKDKKNKMTAEERQYKLTL